MLSVEDNLGAQCALSRLNLILVGTFLSVDCGLNILNSQQLNTDFEKSIWLILRFQLSSQFTEITSSAQSVQINRGVKLPDLQ